LATVTSAVAGSGLPWAWMAAAARAMFQERYAGQYFRRLAQHQAQGDRVEAGSAVFRVERQAQQVGLGEPGPQGAVAAVGATAPG